MEAPMRCVPASGFPARQKGATLVIALLIFGPKKLPELGKGIGEGIKALKSGMKDATNDPPPSITPPATNTPNTDVKS